MTKSPSLLEQLRMFVFFHLGADARLEVKESPEGLHIRIEHRRVHPFRIQLSPSQCARFEGDPEEFENFLLDQLTRYRCS